MFEITEIVWAEQNMHYYYLINGAKLLIEEHPMMHWQCWKRGHLLSVGMLEPYRLYSGQATHLTCLQSPTSSINWANRFIDSPEA